jgi:hypothetical protein
VREPVQRGVAIDLAGKKMRCQEVGPIGRVGPSLRLKADGVGLPIKAAALSGGAGVEIVPRIDSGELANSAPVTGSHAAQECDEVAPSHAILPVEDKAYQRAALCVTAKLITEWQKWVKSGPWHIRERCPLYPGEQTSASASIRSEKCQ